MLEQVKQPFSQEELARQQYLLLHDQTIQRDRGENGRGLFPSAERAFPETYVDSLPSHGGRTVLQLIDYYSQGRRLLVEGNGSPRAVTPVCLDVGYGSGYFLLDVLKYTGGIVTCVGYGPPNDAQNSYLGLPPTYQHLQNEGIQLIDGDIIDIDRMLGSNTADILTASQVFGWVKYPHWEIIKKLYFVLRKNGVCLINACHLQLDTDSIDLEEFLIEHGYDFEINRRKRGEVAFRKTHEVLDLPLSGVVLNTDGYRYGGVHLLETRDS